MGFKAALAESVRSVVRTGSPGQEPVRNPFGGAPGPDPLVEAASRKASGTLTLRQTHHAKQFGLENLRARELATRLLNAVA